MTGLYKNTILTKDESQEIASLLESGESLTTLWLPGSGRTYLGHAFQNTDFFSDILPKSVLDKLIVIYIDQEIGQKFIETHILGNLSQYGSYSMVTEALFSLIKKGHQIVFVIDNFHLDRKFFSYINSLRNVNIERINFIFMTLQSDFEHLKKEYPDSSSLIYHNVIPIAYFTPNQTEQWADHVANRLSMDISNKTKMELAKFTGGIPLLIENYIRFYKTYGNHTGVIDSMEMRILLLKLMGLFTKPEREVMEKLIITLNREDLNLTAFQSRILEYLNSLGLINELDEFSGLWVKKYFDGYQSSPLSIQRGRVYVNDVDLTYQFTLKDIRCLELLSKNSIVEREEVFKAIGKSDDDYSDWAIDKFISRLRSKLKKAGMSKKTIETVRGEGYKFRA